MKKLIPPTEYTSWLDYAVATMDTRGAHLDRIFSDDDDIPSRDEIQSAVLEELNLLKRKTVMPWICMLENWQIALSKRLGRSAESIVENNLFATDFSNDSVRIQFEDGTDLTFRRAFYVGETHNDGAIHRVGVFTEHCGHHEFWIGPSDRISSYGQTGPAYPADDGPLTEIEVEALREDAAKHISPGKTVSMAHLCDAAKDAADRASASIDDALSFLEQSNVRIEAMENGARTGNSVTLNVNITYELNRRLDQMSEKSGNSKSDLLRKAIVLMELAVDENDKGNVLAVTDGQHHVLREIVGI
jgi:hypothetical protein